MNLRDQHHDVTGTVNVEDAASVEHVIFDAMSKRYGSRLRTHILRNAFALITRMFHGRHRQFLPCDTPYHDLRHTLDVTLAMARLIDGHDRVAPPPTQLGADLALIGVVCALFHDAGYLRSPTESSIANGATLTRVHVKRGGELLYPFLCQSGFGDLAPGAQAALSFTDPLQRHDEIRVPDPGLLMIGHMLATADYLAQMSDRAYLEKSRDLLYVEFVHAGFAAAPGGPQDNVLFQSPEDLVRKTVRFYESLVLPKLKRDFGDVQRFYYAHFDGENPYLDHVERMISHLRTVIDLGDLTLLHRSYRSLSRGAQAALQLPTTAGKRHGSHTHPEAAQRPANIDY